MSSGFYKLIYFCKFYGAAALYCRTRRAKLPKDNPREDVSGMTPDSHQPTDKRQSHLAGWKVASMRSRSSSFGALYLR